MKLIMRTISMLENAYRFITFMTTLNHLKNQNQGGNKLFGSLNIRLLAKLQNLVTRILAQKKQTTVMQKPNDILNSISFCKLTYMLNSKRLQHGLKLSITNSDWPQVEFKKV